MEGRINYRGNPVLKRMAQNVVMHLDPAENIKPDKDKSIEKIDGIVATIMALALAIRCQDATSAYDIRGLLFI